MKVTLTQKTAKLFCSKDGLRPAMEHVCYDAVEKALVMTDGCVLAVVALPDAEEPESFLIPIEALPMNGEVCHISLDGKVVIVERHGKKSKSVSTYDACPEQYPPWRAVMPDRDKATGMTELSGWNFEFLGKFGALAKELTGGADCNIVFDGPRAGASVWASGFYGLIMPARLR